MLDAYLLTVTRWTITTEEEILDLDPKRTTLEEEAVLRTQSVLIAIIMEI